MGLELCSDCKTMHYTTDPCRVRKPSVAPTPVVVEAKAVKPSKPRSGDRHRPGYFTEYMRGYRARKKPNA